MLKQSVKIKITFQPTNCPVFYVMFLSFYTFIIISIVQVTDSVNVYEFQRFQPLRNKETLQRIRQNVEQVAKNKRADVQFDEAKLFENIQESRVPMSSTFNPNEVVENNSSDILCELKAVLHKLLTILEKLEKNKNEIEASANSNAALVVPELLEAKKQKRTRNKLLRRPRWGDWTGWSACSVTCGKGREIRWRHCIEECSSAETEMEEKTCQLPACGPGKIFGIQL